MLSDINKYSMVNYLWETTIILVILIKGSPFYITTKRISSTSCDWSVLLKESKHFMAGKICKKIWQIAFIDGMDGYRRKISAKRNENSNVTLTHKGSFLGIDKKYLAENPCKV